MRLRNRCTRIWVVGALLTLSSGHTVARAQPQEELADEDTDLREGEVPEAVRKALVEIALLRQEKELEIARGYLCELLDGQLYEVPREEDVLAGMRAMLAEAERLPRDRRFAFHVRDRLSNQIATRSSRMRSMSRGSQVESTPALSSAVLTAQRGHAGWVRAVQFDPSGLLVLTAADNTACLWEASTGKEVRRFGGVHVSPNAASFSPDGARVLAVLPGADIHFWDVGTGWRLRQFELCTGMRVYPPPQAFFLDDHHVVRTKGDGMEIVEVSTGRRTGGVSIHQFTPDENERFVAYCSAISADGRRLAIGVRRHVSLEDDEWGFSTTPQVLLTGAAILDSSPEAGQSVEVVWNLDSSAWPAALKSGSTFLRLGDEEETHLSQDMAFRHLEFTPDGRRLLAVSQLETSIWDADTGSKLRVVWDAPERDREGYRGRIIGSDGERSIITSWNHTNVATLSHDGELVAAAAFDEWSIQAIESGQVVVEVQAPSRIASIAFSPDDRLLLTGHFDGAARLWDARTGVELRRFASVAPPPASVHLDDSGRVLLVGLGDEAHLWNLELGQLVRRFSHSVGNGVGSTAWGNDVALSGNARYVLTVPDRGQAHLWHAATGDLVRTLGDPGSSVHGTAFSGDGSSVALSDNDRNVSLWDTESGRKIREFEHDQMSLIDSRDRVLSLAFSSDDRRLAAYSYRGLNLVFDVTTGSIELRPEGGEGSYPLVLSPDGRHALMMPWGGDPEGPLVLLDLETNQIVESLETRETRRTKAQTRGGLAYSRDGMWAVSGGEEGTIRVWDTENWTSRILRGHEGPIRSLVLSPDGRWIWSASMDHTVRLWAMPTDDPEAEQDGPVCRIMGFAGGDWAVVDRDGRFDASNGGSVGGLHWVVGYETIDLDQLKERYYEPGLLAKHLGFNAEPLRVVDGLESLEMFPRVTVEPPAPGQTNLEVDLENRGGGIGRVVVQVNGKERTADARGPNLDPEAAEATITLDLAGDPRLLPGEENQVEVLAFNEEGYLRSRGVSVSITPPGEVQSGPPSLYGIVAGVSDYRGRELDLRFPAKDAGDFTAALLAASERLFGPERVHVELLQSAVGAPEGRAASRENILAAIDRAYAAQPGDILVIYLAGHGINHGGQDGEFYFLTDDAQSTEFSDPALRDRVAISSRELTDRIREIPALKQVLILDTCASGRVIERLIERREISGSQVRSLERLKDRTGMYVLAGCAADRVSYEATRYGQGLLTYSLLLGMRGGALREEEYVDVSRLFDFAADRVPDLARDIGGIQRPLVASPSAGSSFDIGRIIEVDRRLVPLQEVKPVFLRSNFQEERRQRDVLGLAGIVDVALRNRTSRDRVDLVFVDAREMPGAYEITGRYQSRDGRVSVSAVLWHGEDEVATIEVEGQEKDLRAMADRIVEQARSGIGK